MNKDDVIIHDVKYKTKSPEEGLIIHEEFAIKGDKGLTIKYYYKDSEHSEKIIIYSKDGEYVVKTTMDNKTEEKTLSEDELIKLLSADKKLNFALNFVKKTKSKKSKTARAKSRKGSKGGSRKRSRKGSRKRSRKGSRKGSRKRSRKGSRK